MNIKVKPIKTSIRFPPFKDRDESITMEVNGLLVEEFHDLEPTLDFTESFVMKDGKATNYPFGKVILWESSITPIAANRWVKSSTYFPAL